jgi:hypothetical protein
VQGRIKFNLQTLANTRKNQTQVINKFFATLGVGPILQFVVNDEYFDM